MESITKTFPDYCKEHPNHKFRKGTIIIGASTTGGCGIWQNPDPDEPIEIIVSSEQPKEKSTSVLVKCEYIFTCPECYTCKEDNNA